MIAGPTAVQLDFQREPGQRARRINRLVLLLGVGLLAAAGVEYVSVEQERSALQANVEASRHARPERGAAARAGGDKQDESTLKAAHAVVAQLAAPWGPLFAALETAGTADVALLTLQAEPASHTIRLSGEARNFPALTAYVRSLESTPAMKDVTLSAHEVRQHDPQRPVVFSLTAKWEAL